MEPKTGVPTIDATCTVVPVLLFATESLLPLGFHANMEVPGVPFFPHAVEPGGR